MGSQGLATANARRGGSEPPLSIVELAAIICTALKSAFGAASAAETRSVQWKGSPVRWKGPRVHNGKAHLVQRLCGHFFTPINTARP